MAKTPIQLQDLNERVEPRHNYIINGGFDFWQRGTTINFTGSIPVTYLADRFHIQGGATGLDIDMNKSSDTPDANSLNSLELVNNVAVSMATSDFLYLSYPIEGHDFSRMFKKTVTASFYVKSSKVGTYTLCILNGAEDANNRIHLLKEYTINQADTWEKKEITFSFDDALLDSTPSAYSLGNGLGMSLHFVLDSGPNRETSTLDTWHNQGVSTSFASTNQIDFCADVSNTFKLTQVKLEIGDTATEFTRAGRNHVEELSMCQRYYYRYHAGGETLMPQFSSGRAASGTRFVSGFRTVTTMRDTVVLSFSSLAHFGVNGAGGAITEWTLRSSTPDVAEFDVDTTGMTTGQSVNIAFANNGGWFGLSAELISKV